MELNVCFRSKKVLIIVAVVAALVLLAIIIALAVIFTRDKESKPSIPAAKPIKPPPTGPPGADGPYKHAVVASDAGPCSEIGRDILKKGGSAMDSAIASLFCIGVYNMHSAGIGGGGFIVVYKKSKNSVEVIDFREEAPGKANRTMYVGGKMNSRLGKWHDHPLNVHDNSCIGYVLPGLGLVFKPTRLCPLSDSVSFFEDPQLRFLFS